MVPSSNEPELMRALLVDKDVPCPSCGYNLRNLVGRVCPECSTLIALSITTVDPLWRYRRLVMLALGLEGVYGVFWGGRGLFGWMFVPGGPSPLSVPVLFAAASGLVYACAGVAALCGLWKLFQACRNQREDIKPVIRYLVFFCWIFVIEHVGWAMLETAWMVLKR